MVNYCKVYLCKNPLNHITFSHKCSKCNEYGHGKYECGNIEKIKYLKKNNNDKLLEIDWCNIDGCKYPYTHKTIDHKCHNCGENHSSKNCPIQSLENLENKYKIINIIKIYDLINSTNNIYVNFKLDKNKSVIKIIDLFVYRKDSNIDLDLVKLDMEIFITNKNNIINTLAISHNLENKKRIINKFIANTTNYTIQFKRKLNNILNKKLTILCPLCRTIVNKKEIFFIKGNDQKCNVCLENNVEVYFPECQHACICKVCLKLIN